MNTSWKQSPTRMRRLAQCAARTVLSAGGGVAVYFSYEPYSQWRAAIIGTGLLIVALTAWGEFGKLCEAQEDGVGEQPEDRGVRLGTAAWLGFVHFLALYLLLLPWVGEFVGAAPYLALAAFEALFGILTGIGGAIILRARKLIWAFPLWYVAVEWLRSTVPFGGFGWVRLSWGQIDGLLSNLAPLGGPVLVTAAAVWVAVGLVLMAQRQLVTAAVSIGVPVALSLAMIPVIWQPGDTPEDPAQSVTVAAIQGNVPRMGLDFNAQRRAVLANHVEETKRLAAEQPNVVDFAIWPENSSDVNPFTDTSAMMMIYDAASTLEAPVMVGTITQDAVGVRNTMINFDPTVGFGDYHFKKYLQPFGETMPMRDFFRRFSEYVNQAGDFKPGTDSGVIALRRASITGLADEQDTTQKEKQPTVTVGVATCYEVAFDPAYRDAVRAGAQILATPTNNATFGFTNMTYQQLAMSRFRAMELDRAVVVAATSGVSAMVLPDGTVTQQSEIFTPAHLVETLPLRESITPAARFGTYLEWLLTIMGGVAVVGAWLVTRKHKTAQDRTQQP
ncbi:MAG: apolipoprotein N-acyltransferase [Corynebacterium sp.]|nr:apolipoprotein N-acyltransferase [Corynebacterium sp.]